GNLHSNEVNSALYQKTDYEEYNVYLNVSKGANASFTRRPSMHTFDELLDASNRFKKDQTRLMPYQIEIWRRLSTAFSPFIFVFLGIGMGTLRTRSVRAGAALIAFGVVLSYWLLQILATNLAQRYGVPPAIAMNLPNIAILVGGLIS